MSEEEKLQLENECLMKYSKAQMIQKYIDELEESSKLSELWCKSQEENRKLKEVIDKVRNIAYEYGQIDGAHHKTWVIDQIIRELLGTEYDNFIKEYEEDGEYTWDIGIAP